MSTSIPVDDIQSLVFSGHSRLPAAKLTGFSVREAGTTAAATLLDLVEMELSCGFGGGERRTRALQLLLSAKGLRRLGGADQEISQLHHAFQQGMTTPPRSRALGDVQANDPSSWEWSDQGIDIVVLSYAETPELVEAFAETIIRRLGSDWIPMVQIAINLPEDGREPFGFRDGLSSVRIDLGDGKKAEAGSVLLPPGEFVLGYSNALGSKSATPRVGENGVYVVLRKMEQQVEEFWKFWKREGKTEEGAVWLAAKAVGRWPNGMPVHGSIATAEPAYDEMAALGPIPFVDDRQGRQCPFGAHIRRANPRDSLGEDPAESLAIVRQHRMIRRGRIFGPQVPSAWYPAAIRQSKVPVAGPTERTERGLIFISLCADIAKQFEFVQQTWLNNPKFAELYDEVDPIAAGRAVPGDARRFSIPRAPLRCRINQLEQWVRIRAGGYFLMPGKNALRRLLGSPTGKLPDRETG